MSDSTIDDHVIVPTLQLCEVVAKLFKVVANQ